MNDDVEVLLDFDRLPNYIGTRREGFSNGRVYSTDDVDGILDWIDRKIGDSCDVSVLIVGKLPTWLAMKIMHHLENWDQVAKVRYSYPNTPIYDVCDKREELMV